MTFKQKLVIALIPARGGSKDVIRKNLRMAGGRPLISYTIEAALNSEFIDRAYVSSEDDEILGVANTLGVFPLRRSDSAASDTSSANMVVLDFISHLTAAEIENDPFIIYLQPTSPLRTASHIDNAFLQMEDRDSYQLISVVALKKSPYKTFILSKDGVLKALFDESLTNANRQSLPETYYPNGAIYIFKLSDFLKNENFPSNGSLPFIMTERESIDIDTEEDLIMLEKICTP